ncbi:cobyrinic acid a,c-diamide synthase [Lachnospiraceae bacterium NE2001]|nr:cobyrinic acid a,c-diamide synthase [Lachnospiraceae bacterium NE2001]
MRYINSKRIMIAAPGSQSGKTTVTCALLEVLKNRGLNPLSYKVGPDYIDPMFHKRVLGIDSRNLDTYFSGDTGIKESISEAGDRYNVIEGVMGLYDGIDVSGTRGSSYEVAKLTRTPIILAVDASGVGRTIISVIKGILLDDTDNLIKGVILNKITASFFEKLRPVMEQELAQIRSDIKVLGFFPKTKGLGIESRHLGLKLPDEIEGIREKITLAADLLEKNVDIPDVISIMEDVESTDVSYTSSLAINPDENSDLTLSVAYDDAFCFYYKENLELFEKSGVNLKFFSPLSDKQLPECDGILLGGGYPENYLSQLSVNKTMLASIREAIDKGVPSLAECGGFMYLHKSIIDMDGNAYEMVGSVDGQCYNEGHLVRFGYMRVESVNPDTEDSQKKDILSDSLVGMKGHEFHYYDSSTSGESFIVCKPNKDKVWNAFITQSNGIWGFPHLYYNSNPKFIQRFIKRMKEVKNGEFQ